MLGFVPRAPASAAQVFRDTNIIKERGMFWTRRQFGKAALSAFPIAGVLESNVVLAGQSRPNSRVRGVMIGMNVPYNFGGRSGSVDEIIQNCAQLGISGLELRSQPVEAFLGVPAHLVPTGRGGGRGRGRGAGPGNQDGPPTPAAAARTPGTADGRGRGQGRGTAPLTPEQQAARQAIANELRKWRLSVPMEKVREVRRRFDDAGIVVEIVKVDGILALPDDETDYAFNLAKNLGARAISTEIADEGPKRLGQFADKHQIMVGYHGHASTGEKDFETVFGYAKYNGANLDIGHFVAGQNTSPVPFIERHHDRITHIHVKDRKANNGPNVPFGQGDTPIAEVLRLIRDNKWNIQATIEFEYPIPEGSDRMTEIRKAIDYCRAALA
jgi:sugar phosphate isomerase/epimerase